MKVKYKFFIGFIIVLLIAIITHLIFKVNNATHSEIENANTINTLSTGELKRKVDYYIDTVGGHVILTVIVTQKFDKYNDKYMISTTSLELK